MSPAPAGSGLRALVVMANPPLPEGGAPGRCGLALIRGLAAHGVDVRAVAARQDFEGDVPPDVRVELVPANAPPAGWSGLPSLLRRPRGHLGRGPLGERVRELAPDVDVVHLEQTETAWCDEHVTTPSLVHVHFRVLLDRSLGVPWDAAFRTVLVYALAERSAIRRHRYLVASSPRIAERLRREAPHADVVHAPLALDPAYYHPSPLDDPPVAGIIGTGFWPPTASAIRRLTDVWPRVTRVVPDARLLIAGRGVDAIPDLVLPDGAWVVGEVASASSFLHSLSVLLYPVERGSGMKVKVLEAMASGVPVVTTRAGAEGIEPNDGVVVEEDHAALAAAAASILRDRHERRERGVAGRRAFLSHYTPEAATKPLIDLYRRMSRG